MRTRITKLIAIQCYVLAGLMAVVGIIALATTNGTAAPLAALALGTSAILVGTLFQRVYTHHIRLQREEEVAEIMSILNTETTEDEESYKTHPLFEGKQL